MRTLFTRSVAVTAVTVLLVGSLTAGQAVQATSLFEVATHGEPEEPEAATDSAGSEPTSDLFTPISEPLPNLRVIDGGLNAAVTLDARAFAGQSVEGLLNALGYNVAPEDVVYPARQDTAPMYGTIFVSRAPGVTLVADGKTNELKTRATTVAALLKEQGVSLDDDDEVAPALDRAIEPNLRIEITRVEMKEEKEKELIAFESTTKDDATIFEGETKVATAGVAGEREVTFKVRFENGDEVSRDRAGEKTLKEPVTEIVLRGTKPRPTTVSEGPYKDIVNDAATKYGVSADELMRVMLCESGGYRWADNKQGNLGLFQFSRGMWGESWNVYRTSDIFSTDAIYAAALAWSLGMRGRWGC